MTEKEIIEIATKDFESLKGVKAFVTKMLILQHFAVQVLHIYPVEQIEAFVNENINGAPKDERFYPWYYKSYICPPEKGKTNSLQHN